jgi:hypothetical protein
MDVPTVGRIVHYVAYGTPGGEYPVNVCRAAVVTEGNATTIGTVGLMVINPTGVHFRESVPYSEQKTAGTWHWPERGVSGVQMS